MFTESAAPSYDAISSCLWDYLSLPPTAQANEAVVVAAIDQTVFTRAAGTIIDDGLYADPVSHRIAVRYSLADLFYHTAELVTERER